MLTGFRVFFLLTFHIKPLLGQSYSYDVCGNTCKAVGNLEFWTEGALSHRHTAAVRPNVGVMCPLVVTSGPDRSLHNLSHTVINMNDLFFESQRKGFCWGFQLVFYTIYVKDFFSCVSLTICFCIDWNVLSFFFFHPCSCVMIPPPSVHPWKSPSLPWTMLSPPNPSGAATSVHNRLRSFPLATAATCLLRFASPAFTKFTKSFWKKKKKPEIKTGFGCASLSICFYFKGGV